MLQIHRSQLFVNQSSNITKIGLLKKKTDLLIPKIKSEGDNLYIKGRDIIYIIKKGFQLISFL